MHTLTISIDLPSAEIQRDAGAWDWVRGTLGLAIDRGVGREKLLADACAVLRRLELAFADVGVSDVICAFVDDDAVYVDTVEDSGDLALALKTVCASEAAKSGARRHRVVLSHRHESTHYLLDASLTPIVPKGTAELEIRLEARSDGVLVRRGERAGDYAQRLEALASDGRIRRAELGRLRELGERLARAIRDRFPSARVGEGEPQTRLILPGRVDVARMRELNWGSTVRKPRYRSTPVQGRRGAYATPFHEFYFDAYSAFRDWVLVRAVLERGCWNEVDLVVVGADGTALFTGSSASKFDVTAGLHALTPGVLEISAQGNLRVDAKVGRADAADAAEIGHPGATRGYAASEDADAGTGGENEG